ncbi:helix-turn-helix domain-containing protein [Thalassococcus sp. S3]|uniref:MerR family transcriptional regulator n=1 Tax=Thalassococcus sp. S3 TaxID=2017482 RepID=UPI0010243DAA|nr:helix-turn-helix domain-containing protein [Thalassococcus sp. S3]QBF32751.1 transcriptional regulator [Thalassococcus sp. S3]
MFSIGALSRQTGVKVPTIRYYEEIGLVSPAGRNAGNQRRYDSTALDRLGFVKHARELGFSIPDIRVLLGLQDNPDQACAEASAIAIQQRDALRNRIAQLQRLERELTRIADGCPGDEPTGCAVLTALSDHSLCTGPHQGA